MMNTKEIRLIAMDMDGTLLNSKQQVSEENAAALRDAQRQGIHLAICSGRSPGDIGLFALENGLENCSLLALNGSCCTHGLDHAPFANHCIETSALDAAVDILREAGLLFCCFSQNRLAGIDSKFGEKWGYSPKHNGDPRAPEVFYGMEGYEQIKCTGINKIVCTSSNHDLLSKVRLALEQVPNLDITSSWRDNLELMPAGCHKGTAVKELAEEFGLTADEVMTFGDYDNDEGMIRYAGMGIAMGNGSEKIRRMAKLITLTNDENGVAFAIRRYALKH